MSALPQMSSPSDRPKRCPNSFRVRVPDTQMCELRPRVRCAGANRSVEVRCSWMDRQRASAANVRPSSGNVIFHSVADPIWLVQEEVSVAERGLRVLINSNDDCLDVLVAPTLARGGRPRDYVRWAISRRTQFSHAEIVPARGAFFEIQRFDSSALHPGTLADLCRSLRRGSGSQG